MFRREIVNPQKLLKSLEPAIKNPKSILTQRHVNRLTNTKHREALSLLIISEVLNKSFRINKENKYFQICKNISGEDKLDGYLKFKNGKSEKYFEFEQVLLTISEFKNKIMNKEEDLSDLIIGKIRQKHNKYTQKEQNILVILLDITGSIYPNKIKKYLKKEAVFSFYIIILLNEEVERTGTYEYNVIDLNPLRKGYSVFTFKISKDFKSFSTRLNP